MATPAQPVLLSYSGITHVITGTAEPGASVAIFDDGIQFGPTVEAAGDGSFAIALGELTEVKLHNFVAVATNVDGASPASPAFEINVRPAPFGEWISAETAGDYDFTGTDLGDNLGFRTEGQLTLRGAGGDDIYYVDSLDDLIVEDADGGYDRIDIVDDASLTEYTLPDNVEWLAGPSENMLLNGNDADNDVVGRGTLNGGAGNDTVRGIGNETFDPGSLLLGGEGDDTLSGDNGNDTIDGGAGDNDLVIYGQPWGSGLRAGDVYITAKDDGFEIYDVRDFFETFHHGKDFVRNVEFFQFIDQTIAVEDLLDRSTLPPPPPQINFLDRGNGQVGGTALPGVTVVVERTTNFGSSVVELGRVTADIDGNWMIDADPALYNSGRIDSYAENPNGRSSESTYFLLGDFAGTPGSLRSRAYLDDTLIGTDASDSLSGGYARSTLIGGAGDDFYYLDEGVTILEEPDGGTDTVYAAMSEYTLADTLENVIARASSSVLNGNDANNLMTGNDRTSRGRLFETRETLNGGAGNDTLNGLRGDDVLDGGPGIDTAIFSGDSGDYLVTRESGGFRLVDQRNDDAEEDGSDLVFAVEFFQFADATLTPEQLNVQDTGILVEGGPEPDSLTADSGDDTLRGLGGNDTLAGLSGNDLLEGGEGIDVALYQGGIMDFTAISANGEITVSRTADSETDTLVDMERVRFDDLSLAFDLDGTAGTIARLLGVVLGKDAWSDGDYQGVGLAVYMGVGLDILDNLVIATDALMDVAFEVVLEGKPTNTEVVNLVYTNLVGFAPSPQDLAALTADLLDSGAFTQGELGVLAMNHELNLANIDLVGLTQYGVEYLPVG